MLEGVLTKPPFLSRRIFDDFLSDLSNVKGIIVSDEDLEKYLTKKYFEKLTSPVENQIIKSLWKIVFKVDDADCNSNREINFKALDILFDRNYNQVLNYIKSDVEGYSDVSVKFIDYLIDFFNNYPNVFKLMAEHTQIVIKNKVKEDAGFEAAAIFLSKGIKEHLILVAKKFPKIDISTINSLYHIAVLEGHQRGANAFIIKMFGASTNFNMADARYNEVIQDFLQEFDANELMLLLQEINSNDQIYDRSRARFTNRTIKRRCIEVLGEDFNFKKYPNFYHSLQEE